MKPPLVFLPFAAALALTSCETSRTVYTPGTAHQPAPYGNITFTPTVPVDIGRAPRPLSQLVVPKLEGIVQVIPAK